MIRRLSAAGLAVALVATAGPPSLGQENTAGARTASPRTAPDRFDSKPLLAQGEWQRLDGAVDRALAFIAQSQSSDGSFPTHVSGQPAVTSICIMAFLSRGHVPNEGPYGKQISRAIDFVLDSQDGNGALMFEKLGNRPAAHFEGNYNHSISGLMLGEVYGMSTSTQHERIRTAIERALELSREQQIMVKRTRDERGGWRYMRRFGVTDSDLSVTAWQLMFLRSARNAEFEVPQQWIDEGMGYVRRSFDPVERGFVYGLYGEDRYVSRGMAGAGVVSLSLGGEHNTDIAKSAGGYILQHGFDRYNRGGTHPEDRYHYSAFYCSQAMFQLGGDYWFRFFPKLLDTLVENQRGDGSWEAESLANDRKYGNIYSTGLTVLTLTPPYQLLPIYQR
ncbi:MAG: prenyltransferase/squalene oxidase repeat-containing protein [Planctomycetaceae bacterium]